MEYLYYYRNIEIIVLSMIIERGLSNKPQLLLIVVKLGRSTSLIVLQKNDFSLSRNTMCHSHFQRATHNLETSTPRIIDLKLIV